MTHKERNVQFSEIALQSMREGVAKAIERHRRLGESIVVMENGKIIELSADQITPSNISVHGKP